MCSCWIRDVFWLGPPARIGAGSKTHLKFRCCAILKRGGDIIVHVVYWQVCGRQRCHPNHRGTSSWKCPWSRPHAYIAESPPGRRLLQATDMNHIAYPTLLAPDVLGLDPCAMFTWCMLHWPFLSTAFATLPGSNGALHSISCPRG